MKRLPLILSATALAVALLGSTPLGHATSGIAYGKKKIVVRSSTDPEVGYSANDVVSHDVNCQAGEVAVGGGYSVLMMPIYAFTGRSGPKPTVEGFTPTGWAASIGTLQADADAFLRVYAVCMKA
jgi:hypothetical protein